MEVSPFIPKAPCLVCQSFMAMPSFLSRMRDKVIHAALWLRGTGPVTKECRNTHMCRMCGQCLQRGSSFVLESPIKELNVVDTVIPSHIGICHDICGWGALKLPSCSCDFIPVDMLSNVSVSQLGLQHCSCISNIS